MCSMPTHPPPQPFGQTCDGVAAHRYTLTNRHGLRVDVSDLGCTIVSILVPDRAGTVADVVLGYHSAAEYGAARTIWGAWWADTPIASPMADSPLRVLSTNLPATMGRITCTVAIVAGTRRSGR